jgi:hypothetical protein
VGKGEAKIPAEAAVAEEAEVPAELEVRGKTAFAGAVVSPLRSAD